MRKLKLSSTVGILETVAQQTASNLANRDALNTILGDENTPGSLKEQEKLGKLFIDSLVNNVDLTQVETNRLNLERIMGPIGTENSVIRLADVMKGNLNLNTDWAIVPVVNEITDNRDALAVLNGPSSVDGSINQKISVLVGTAPESLDTLKELSMKLTSEDEMHVSIQNLIDANKADSISAIETQENVLSAYILELQQKFTAEEIAGKGLIETGFGDALNGMSTKYLTIDNLFSEFLASSALQATARANIGAINLADVLTYITENNATFKRENFTVSDSVITLDSRVGVQHVDKIIINYPNFEYDTLIVDKINDTDYRIVDTVDGDLDQTVVEVSYVLDKSSTEGVL